MKIIIEETAELVRYEFTSGNAAKNVSFNKLNEEGKLFDTEKLSDDEYQRWLTWLESTNQN